MSVVSGVTLIFSIREEGNVDVDQYDLLDQINARLKARRYGPLQQVQSFAGGSKHPQCVVCCSGYNHFVVDAGDFVRLVMGLPWEEPANVVLVIQPEEGPTAVHQP